MLREFLQSGGAHLTLLAPDWAGVINHVISGEDHAVKRRTGIELPVEEKVRWTSHPEFAA